MTSNTFSFDSRAVKKLKLIAVAYSAIEREWFATEDAYKAELEVENRAKQVVEQIKTELGIEAKGYPADQYFLTNIMIDKPDLVVNLVDTVKGSDKLQPSVPAALELTGIPYTGTGISGLVIGNNRQMVKQLLQNYEIPTPRYQYIKPSDTIVIADDFMPPYIIKLNEGGGSIGLDNKAVKETVEDANKQIKHLFDTYHIPVIVEQYIEGEEITSVVIHDGKTTHVFLGQKEFNKPVDGKHYYTSLDSYSDKKSYTYEKVDPHLELNIKELSVQAFAALKYRDYAKFDIRLGNRNNTPYFIDANPNTAFGPHIGLPFTEVLAMHKVPFSDVLKSLISKHAKRITSNPENVPSFAH